MRKEKAHGFAGGCITANQGVDGPCQAELAFASLKPVKPRPPKPNARRQPGSERPPAGTGKSLPASKPMTYGRRWLFRVLAALVLPLLVLGVLEVGLRLGGYGHDTSFFKPMQFGGQEMLVENDSYSFRFFPAEVARLPRPIMIEPDKPADVYRIFVFGESAAEGDPDPAFGPARFMEVLLRERFPELRFEIVNVAVTANNSHGILPIARECARLHGDLWIIYMGNNEMIGPFGAAGMFGRPAPPLRLVRANLALQQTRLGQLLQSVTGYFAKRAPTPSEWGGLEMFAANHINPADPSKERVYRNFRGNLHDIIRVGLDSGARIVLNAVAVNLRECPPLGSETSTALAPAERSTRDRLNAEAKMAEDKNDPAAAAKCLEQAAALDPRCAELQYRWGQCLLQMTNFSSARVHFQLACDNDAFPARTDSRINTLIYEAAQSSGTSNLVFFDAPAALATNRPAGICGSETFYEHVHFNPGGSYRLGLAWAEQAETLLPEAIRRKATAPWAAQALCERRLALTPWNRRNDLNEIVSRRHTAPLKDLSNNAQQLAKLQQELAELGQRMDAAGAMEASQMCAEAVERAPKDMDLHCNFADFLEAVGNVREAAGQWQQVQQLRPAYYLGYFQEGRMLERMGELESARTAFQKTVSLRPLMAPAWFELSNIAASEGDLNQALQDLERASGIPPKLPVYYACMGKLLSRMDRHADAVERYRQALRADPNYWDGHIALGGEFASQGNWPAAQTEFEVAVRLRPDSTLALVNLGGALARQGQSEAAQREVERALELEPGNQPAQALLSQLRQERSGTK